MSDVPMAPDRFTLDANERNHPLWRRIAQHIEERLEDLRVQNDAPLSPERTADIRGRIAQLKELLILGYEPRIPTD